jgi:metal-dependent amidase/aminoacylase/carboxypeptidase family protein
MKDVMDQNAVPEPVVSRMRGLRRALHRHPELAFQEERTAARIMAELDDLAIPYDYGGVGSGVIGRHGCPVG